MTAFAASQDDREGQVMPRAVLGLGIDIFGSVMVSHARDGRRNTCVMRIMTSGAAVASVPTV